MLHIGYNNNNNEFEITKSVQCLNLSESLYDIQIQYLKKILRKEEMIIKERQCNLY